MFEPFLKVSFVPHLFGAFHVVFQSQWHPIAPSIQPENPSKIYDLNFNINWERALKILLIILSLFLASEFMGAEETRMDSIRNALIYQKSHYPVSQYRDVYKNFMQDFFGPGHIINEKRTACDNLLKEMNSVEYYDGPDYEPTGFQGNFYRVNLRLITEGVIPCQTFLDAFVESVQGITPPAPDFWLQVWKEIDNEISSLNMTFENEEQDREALNEGFSKGNFVVHHSDAYNDAVNFHYRIISKEIFKDRILPLLNSN